jgi:hypothetical protein
MIERAIYYRLGEQTQLFPGVASGLLGDIYTWTLTCWTNINQILTKNVKFVKMHVEHIQGRHFIGKKRILWECQQHRKGVGVGG